MLDFLAAAKILSSKRIDPTALITDWIPFDEIDRAFERAIDPNAFRAMVMMAQ